MKKVVFFNELPGDAKKWLESKKYSVKILDRKILKDRKRLLPMLKNADAIIPLLVDKIDKELIDSMQQCRVIANYAAGYDNIDVEYASRKNIIVTNTPNILTDATADIAIGLLLACARKFIQSDRFMRSSKFKGWMPDLMLGHDLRNKIFGIVGAGRIGKATAQRAKAFGCKIIYFNRSPKPEIEKELNAKRVSLNYLMKNADFISLHIPSSVNTYHLIDKEKLNHMKPDAILINTARGEVVDEKYLIKMLKKNKIFAAGFDVYEGEPKVNPELLKLNNVVLLPHIGSATLETRSEMAMLCAKNVHSILQNKNPLTPVNF
ncbi:MAG: D-glycerate dehydrogenase [Melioribacteraceae bacterium]|nr:D-glycerate dehydrogenase [Melioribacteraceae bacterium]MDD3559659.1 D-glycerate dehydrogenase [Melioribacteraceae bacterium]